MRGKSKSGAHPSVTPRARCTCWGSLGLLSRMGAELASRLPVRNWVVRETL